MRRGEVLVKRFAYCSGDQWAAVAECCARWMRAGMSASGAARMSMVLGAGSGVSSFCLDSRGSCERALRAIFRKDLGVGAANVIGLQVFGRDGLTSLNLFPTESRNGITSWFGNLDRVQTRLASCF